MRILIVGAGALGGTIGAYLSEAGEDVVLLEKNEARVRLLLESGLHITEVGREERCVPLNVVSELDGLEPVDLIFISVKTYQTESAARSALPVAKDDTMVLSMQNGIGNTETLAGLVGAHRVLTGITYHSIQHVGPNRLCFRKGIKPIQIAPMDGEIRPAIERVAEVFGRAGLDTDVVPSIDATVWQKLLHNAVINPVSALTGLTCQELLHDDEMQAFMRDLCMEIVTVMRARGVPIADDEDPYRPLLGSQKALGKNRPSMWQDLSRGMLTEIDAINGAVVREAERLGLQAPHNKALVHFTHSREFHKLQHRQQQAHASKSTTGRTTRSVVRSTGVDPEGGMPEGRVPLRCAQKLRTIVGDYYRSLENAANNPARRVAWVSGTGPVELLRAFGYDLYFPENHAALIGATRLAGRYITRSLAEGFSPFASSAMTSDIGAMLAGESPLLNAHGVQGPPRPDVAVYDTNFGRSLVHWFEHAAGRFGVPVMGLHPPPGLARLSDADTQVAAQQVGQLTSQLEQLQSERLVPDRFAEVVALSAEACALWKQVLELARTVPSPLTFFDMLVHMAPIVMLRGTQQAIEYYRTLLAELEERVEGGQAAVPGEQYRFFWEGPPIWCALRPLARLFMEHRVAIVASTYGGMFAFDGLDPNNPVESTARAYAGLFTNLSDRAKDVTLRTWFDHYGVDGVIFHDGRTSPELSNVRYGLARRLQEQTGLPALVVEADSHDPRLFSMDQVRRLVSQFLEQANAGRVAALRREVTP